MAGCEVTRRRDRESAAGAGAGGARHGADRTPLREGRPMSGDPGAPRPSPSPRPSYARTRVLTGVRMLLRGGHAVPAAAAHRYWAFLNHLVGPHRFDLRRIDAEPLFQHIRRVGPESRRSFDVHHLAVNLHRPCRHLVLAGMVLYVLHEAALLEARL